jgi:putative ABC transport system permease protein
MNGFWNGLRFGWRQLAARPGFAAAAILTLALGIGANTAVFSVLNGYLLKSLPYPNAGELEKVQVHVPKFSASEFGVSAPMYEVIRKSTKGFSDVAVYDSRETTLKLNGRAIEVRGIMATAALFQVLGARPMLGRTFSAASSQPGRGHQIVISYGFWQRVFGGARNVIGKTLPMDGTSFQIIGVMPPGFEFPDEDVNFWQPLTISPDDLAVKQMFKLHLGLIGRLKSGVDRAALQQQLAIAASRICGALPAATCEKLRSQGFKLTTQSYHHYLVRGISSTLLLLQGAVLLILLITCVNVANLLLSRILVRRHEIAMRAALGATRLALARQLLVEGLCLATPGGILGVAAGWFGLRYLSQSSLGTGGDVFNIAFDWSVVLFAAVAVGVTALLVSLLPLYHLSKMDMQRILQEGGRTTAGGRDGSRIRNALVTSEIMLATALLAGSGLLLHSFVNLTTLNTGFRKNDVLLVHLIFPSRSASIHSAYKRVVEGAQSVPGVAQVGLGSDTPFSGGYPTNVLEIRGYDRPPGASIPSAVPNIVTRGYFGAMDIPILRGRNFDPQETPDSRRSIIIDSRIAKKYFSSGDAIGRQVRLQGWGDEWFTVIGVVPPVKIASLSQQGKFGGVYLSASQFQRDEMDLVVHTTVPPGGVGDSLRQTLAQAAPSVAVDDIETMRQRLSGTLRDEQTTLALLLIFGGVALALAVVGVYGVMSYAVGQRRTECGVRLALGALPEDLFWLLLKDGLKLLGIGLAIGLALAVIFGFVLSSRLFGIEPYDPLILIGTVIALATITLIACYIPARRAAKLDPAVAMMEQ